MRKHGLSFIFSFCFIFFMRVRLFVLHNIVGDTRFMFVVAPDGWIGLYWHISQSDNAKCFSFYLNFLIIT